jgi:arsenate reductase (glutaredoxin)
MTRIYHNPKCSTSRKVLAALKEHGEAPEIIEYLKSPPSKAELKDLLKRMNISARDLLRKKETLYRELGLDDPKISEAKIVDAMLEHPILIERPIVVTNKGVRLCRPPEAVEEIL